MDQRLLAPPGPPVRPKRAPWAGVGCAIAALVGAPLALIGGAVYVVHSMGENLNPPAPNVAAVARSAPVDDADLSATNSLNDEASRLQQILPWIHPVARGVDDTCSTWSHDGSFGRSAYWLPISCTRKLAWFGSFDGSLPAQQARIDAALQHAGLTPQGTSETSYGDQNFTVDIALAPSTNLDQLTGAAPGILTLTGGSPTPVPADTAIRALTQVTSAQLTAGATPQSNIISLTLTAPYYVAPTSSPTPTPPQDGGGCVTGAYCAGG